MYGENEVVTNRTIIRSAQSSFTHDSFSTKSPCGNRKTRK